MPSGLRAPWVDERCQRWPNALRNVEKDVRANLTNSFDFLEQFPDFRGGRIRILEIVVCTRKTSRLQALQRRARIHVYRTVFNVY